ncbi:unnamed protein product [Rangifer tarandus platyrhynchus]|uniref:Uncharacterized protein n=1 Tax=Rangifer tarandus platyrhynchus TaxID=3082113 RepID=A0AC59Z6Q5_RANTA
MSVCLSGSDLWRRASCRAFVFVCVCVLGGGGGRGCLFHSGAKSDLCSKTGLDCASHLCVRQRGVSAHPVCYPQVQPVSWGSTPPSSRAEVRGQDASTLVFPAESCCVLSPPDSVCAT